MRRLIGIIATLSALIALGVFAATASAGGNDGHQGNNGGNDGWPWNDNPSLTVSQSCDSNSGEVTLTWVIHNPQRPDGYTRGAGNGVPPNNTRVPGRGSTTFTETVPGDVAQLYYSDFKLQIGPTAYHLYKVIYVNGTCTASGGGGGSPAPVVVVIPQSNDAFVCYSIGGTPQEVNTDDVPADYAAGNWVPQWVSGNVAGGENIGNGHLICAVPMAGGPGNMPVATVYHDTNNQLNGYHDADSAGFIGQYPSY